MIPSRRRTQAEVEAELRDLVERLIPYGPQQVILHGSLARGDWNRASDIDLIIVKDTDHPFLERIGEVLALCNIDMNVEPLVYTPAELSAMLEAGSSFLQQALAEGRILYESQPVRG